MSFGRMNSFIILASQSPIKDAEGFSQMEDFVLAKVRAYKEDKHGSEIWKNRSMYSEATCLFRFRTIPNLAVTTSNIIICDGACYRILSVEDVRGKGMYIEALASQIIPSMR